jgi:multiple sugar transport system substrate-binding protein
MKRRRFLGMFLGLLLLSCSVVLPSSYGKAKKTTLHLISHRYAALEFYADALAKEAPANTTVEAELMTYGDWQQKTRINLSSHSSAYDITYIFPPDMGEFASKGWLLPLDKYVKKYWKKYNFGDIPQVIWDAYKYKGKIYGIPSHQWAMFMFVRSDIFKKKGIKIPETLDEMVTAAKELTDKDHFGTVMTLKAADHLALQFQVFLTACGGWWFDEDMKPAFNSPQALKAIRYIQDLIPYCPPGVNTYGSDEAMIAMAQDRAVFSLQQGTRSAQMNNPAQSKVVGLVDFLPAPPQKKGGPRASLFSTAGYSIPAFTKNDPDLIFRTIANATDQETMTRGAAVGMPVRKSVLTDKLLAERPDYKASYEALKSGARMRPAIPEFNEIMEVSMRALAKVLVGQAEAKSAMDQAANEAYKIMKAAGYYKK